MGNDPSFRKGVLCPMNKWLIILAVLIASIAAGCSGNTDRVTLNVYNWGDYIDESVLKQFEQEYSINIVYDTYDRNEDMYAELKKSGANYDVCIPSDYMIEKMTKEGMLAEIDFKNIPNYKYVRELFKGLSFDPENRYSVPYLWGTIGIVYNKNEVRQPVDSWQILWDPQYKGLILMMDSPRDSFMVAEKKLGFSMNTSDAESLEAAKNELIIQKPLVLSYENDAIKDMMINNEAAMAVAWSGEAIYMMDNNENLAYAVPKEGTNMWFDNLVIPKNALHKKEAELFIDFLCRPDIALKNAIYIGYSTPNQGCYDMMTEEMKQNKVIYPDVNLLEQSEVYRDLGPQYVEQLDRAWTEVKSK